MFSNSFVGQPDFIFQFQAECYFGCQLSCDRWKRRLVSDVSCLVDCFSSDPSNCLSGLLSDIMAKGVCNNKTDVYTVSGDCDILPNYTILHGTCSDNTEKLLVTKECKMIIAEQQHFLLYTIQVLMRHSCRTAVWREVQDFIEENQIGRK